MTFKKNIHWLLYIVLFLLISCARQSTPTGGPKDTIPPVLIRSDPANEQINFKGKSLDLTFSEMITTNNPKEEILITPSIGKDYEVTFRNNKVLLKFESDLKDSTTYAFNFREAVQDITEKNKVRNLRIAVSTGSYIDSLSVSGLIMDLVKEVPVKDATVAIQPYSDTFSILKHPATYFSKSDKDGKFKLENLKPGKYMIYAIADQNKNLIADSKTEAYGFLRDSFQLDSIKTKVTIPMVKLDTRLLKITSARAYNTYYNIRTSKNLKTFSVTSATDSSNLFYTYGEDRSNLRIYNSISPLDSIQINLSIEDSIQNKFDTTMYAKFSTREVTPEKFDFNIKSTVLLADKGSLKMKLHFNKPIQEVNFDSISFIIDSLNVLSFKKENLTYDHLKRELTIDKTFDKKLYVIEEQKPSTDTASQIVPKKKVPEKAPIKNQVAFGKGAFTSIEKDSSASLKQPLRVLRTESLGLISIIVNTKSKNILIELLDRSKTIVGSVENKNKASFEDLMPDEYQLRIIVDRNNNGVWDPGNYLKKEEPEEIYYYENEKGVREIKLKENFELGPLLITY